MKFVGLIVVAVVAVLVLAFTLLPWWAVLGGIGLAVLTGYFFSGRIFEAVLKIPFRAKGAVLRGATAEVHSLTAMQQDRLWLLDVTITPLERAGGGFHFWEPGELRLVSLEANAGDTGADGAGCEIQRVEIESETGLVADEGMKYGGPQRLRLTIATAPGARNFQFRYYFELFGAVSLPAGSVAQIGLRE